MNLAQISRKLPTTRNGFLRAFKPPTNIFCNMSTTSKPPSSSSSSSSSSSDSSDDDVIERKKSDKEVLNRLNSLLQQMVADEDTHKKATLNLAKPIGRNKLKQSTPKIEPVEKQVINAAKTVAESIGGDKKQTESELLAKLLNQVDAKQSSNLSDIIKGMKIERNEKLPEQTKAEQVRQFLKKINTQPSQTNVQRRDRRKPPQKHEELNFESIDLFGGQPLGIFTDPSKLTQSPQLSTWQTLQEKELKLAVTHPPANYFQQMILWTEQGKVWQFPINNEFGMDEEAKVYFADHIFLEEHLESWCPPKGPIRHFMELVCVGLSKNYHLTVEAKKEHIEWYKNYFEDKKALLQEVGALPVEKPADVHKE